MERATGRRGDRQARLSSSRALGDRGSLQERPLDWEGVRRPQFGVRRFWEEDTRASSTRVLLGAVSVYLLV